MATPLISVTLAAAAPGAAAALAVLAAGTVALSAAVTGAQAGRRAYWAEEVGRDGGATRRRESWHAVAWTGLVALVAARGGPGLGVEADVAAMGLGALYLVSAAAACGLADGWYHRYVLEADRTRTPLPEAAPPVAHVAGALLGSALGKSLGNLANQVTEARARRRGNRPPG